MKLVNGFSVVSYLDLSTLGGNNTATQFMKQVSRSEVLRSISNEVKS